MHERWGRVFGSGGEMRKSMPRASSPHKKESFAKSIVSLIYVFIEAMIDKNILI